MFGLDSLMRLIKLLNKGASPNQLAGAFALGSLLGLIPGWPLPAFFLIFIILLVNINLSMVLFATAIGSMVAWLADPIFHAMGLWLLEDVSGLQGLWTALYNHPIAILTRFNNSVMMGALTIGLILQLPLFFLFRWFVIAYREKLMARLNQLKVIQWIRGSRLYALYQQVSDGS